MAFKGRFCCTYVHAYVAFIGRLYCESWYGLNFPDDSENLIYPMIRRRAVDEKVLVRKAAITVCYEMFYVCVLHWHFYHTCVHCTSSCTPLPYLCPLYIFLYPTTIPVSLVHLLVPHYLTCVPCTPSCTPLPYLCPLYTFLYPTTIPVSTVHLLVPHYHTCVPCTSSCTPLPYLCPLYIFLYPTTIPVSLEHLLVPHYHTCVYCTPSCTPLPYLCPLYTSGTPLPYLCPLYTFSLLVFRLWKH